MVEFEWDEDNVEHFARHGIAPDEVEQVLYGRIVRRRGRVASPDRRRVLGRTYGGRYLVILYQIKGPAVIRPYTGWDMRPHERRLYDQQVQ